MPINQFTETLAGIINGFAAKLKAGAVIALIIQPTQWKAPDKQFTPTIWISRRAPRRLPIVVSADMHTGRA